MPRSGSAPARSSQVIDWLLEEEQPSIRYLALSELLGRARSDPSVLRARREVTARGWAADILARRDPGGWWVSDRNLYRPKYTGTNWNLLALSDLGVDREVPEVDASCELWMARAPLKGGGVGGNSNGNGHHCFTANMARALVRFGYVDDPRVRRAFEWLVETAHPKGGWSCFASMAGPATSRNLDSWEGLSAFAVYPRSKWNRSMTDTVERAAEFFLERELHRQGARYDPWYRFHWPVHYYYDLLVGMDMLTALGYGSDPRLGYALDHLRRMRRPDGTWHLDAVHPDVGGAMARWYAAHPADRPTPLAFEAVGRPSKMITLRALTVLARIGES